MVKAKLDTYYTFRLESEEPLMYQCMKWEEGGDQPLEVYRIDPFGQSNRACSCQAYTTRCKHVKCLEEARYDGKAEEFWKWRWDAKKGWQPLGDIAPIDEFSL